jgi:hypothetical protein
MSSDRPTIIEHMFVPYSSARSRKRANPPDGSKIAHERAQPRTPEERSVAANEIRGKSDHSPSLGSSLRANRHYVLTLPPELRPRFLRSIEELRDDDLAFLEDHYARGLDEVRREWRQRSSRESLE